MLCYVVTSAVVSKRRGSARGIEVKKRTSCLSTLTLYNEELLDKTIEEIFHTDSYSGWCVPRHLSHPCHHPSGN